MPKWIWPTANDGEAQQRTDAQTLSISKQDYICVSKFDIFLFLFPICDCLENWLNFIKFLQGLWMFLVPLSSRSPRVIYFSIYRNNIFLKKIVCFGSVFLFT